MSQPWENPLPIGVYGKTSLQNLEILSILGHFTTHGLEWLLGHIHGAWLSIAQNIKYGPQVISCSIGPFGQFPKSPTPRPIPLNLGLDGSSNLPGASCPSSHIQGLSSTTFDWAFRA
ncbi:hypothetical protein O181_120768 [Austropuccinia psidii MF-1]|uniref:Uncharacterized protein n=1 Tax=Austropuccinia psidii MF-1 TaxID=1389203 RepID=A0A9Q3KGB4_9BASI|nr:hypothetical protein [Austropuccinia psidii MF-1]